MPQSAAHVNPFFLRRLFPRPNRRISERAQGLKQFRAHRRRTRTEITRRQCRTGRPPSSSRGTRIHRDSAVGRVALGPPSVGANVSWDRSAPSGLPPSLKLRWTSRRAEGDPPYISSTLRWARGKPARGERLARSRTRVSTPPWAAPFLLLLVPKSCPPIWGLRPSLASPVCPGVYSF